MARSPESLRLAEALAALNARQHAAVSHEGNVVVLAGPGSGKTRVLTVRAARLLATSVPRRSALAAITFTNAAADEMRERLGRLGIPQSRRVVVETAHAFCLNEILVAHRDILPNKLSDDVRILSERTSGEEGSAALKKHGLSERPEARVALLRARRGLAIDGTFAESDEPYSAAVKTYSRMLDEEGVLDFEEVVIRALGALKDPTILRLVANRFTHLLVDEYQDLGPVLHAIVTALHAAGTEISAVGDPNQSILGFTGASAAYLRELCDRQDFETVELALNYRSAASIVSAASRLVDSTVPVQRNVRDVEGVIHHIRTDGDQSAHALAAVSLVRNRLSAGVSPGEIALLYPRKGVFLTALLEELNRQGVQYFHERADVIPRGRLARWVSRCALRSMLTDTPGASLPNQLTIPSLADELGRLSRNRTRHFRRTCGRHLVELFQSERNDDQPAHQFTAALVDATGVRELMDTWPDETDKDDLRRLLELTDVPASMLASSISPTAVTVTTYQSAKGREFDVVVLPGLVEGNVPFWSSTGPPAWGRQPPDEESICEERRAFYVAVTRARNELYLITGSGWTNKGGFWELQHHGPSRYVSQLLEHIE